MRSTVTCRSWLPFVALVCAVSLPTATALADDHDTGFEAGLRSGYAIALGKEAGNTSTDLSQDIAGQVPLWLDVGYRVLPELFVGLYGQYGFGFTGDNMCDTTPNVDCSAVDTRLGLQLHYHPAPHSDANPWLGLGFGYEWLTLGVDRPGLDISITIHGFELLNLQAGLDFEVAERFHIGPAVSFSLGQYGDASLDCSSSIGGCDVFDALSANISNKALHEWLFLGVRGAYGP